jgi:polar amino acid transport system substrate-binding protein
MKKVTGLSFEGVATAGGLSGQQIMKSFGFKYCTTDYKELLKDGNIDIIFILTRHDSHARFVCEAMRAGKAVFVEKPLCINEKQLKEIVDVYYAMSEISRPFLMVGFNRRFAPATGQALEFLAQDRAAGVVQIRCNAGYIPPESWVHKADEGGGRIIGEVCHFVDLAQAITGGLPKKVFASALNDAQGLRDNLIVSLQMDNGAIANIAYAANGDKSFPREEVQIFSGGSVCVIDNFKNLQLVSSGKTKNRKSLEADRGHTGEIKATVEALRNGRVPLDFKSIVATTVTAFAIEKSISAGSAMEVNLTEWLTD